MSDWLKYRHFESPAVKYRLGRITLVEASEEAKTTPIEMMEYLTRTGYHSQYSVDDFKKAQGLLENFLNYKPRPKRK